MKATSDTVPKVVDKDACDVPAIEICDLRVDYGDFVAVDDIRLQVPPGRSLWPRRSERRGKDKHLCVCSPR